MSMSGGFQDCDPGAVAFGVHTVARMRFPDASSLERAERELSGTTHCSERELCLVAPLASSALETAIGIASRYNARVGVATGEGDAAIRCSQTALDAADPGQVVACLSTVELARDKVGGDLRFHELGAYETTGSLGRVRLFLLHTTSTVVQPAGSSGQSLFVGRQRELGQLRRQIDLGRLVTVVGSIGIGKSAFLRRFVTEFEDDFADGAWVVDLSDLADGTQVLPRICHALEVDRGQFERSLDALGAFVAGRKALLVLDGIERWIEHLGPIVSYLYVRAPDLQMVCAGNRRLRLPEERIFRLGGLETASEDTPASLMIECDAVSLFVDRAQMVDPSFTLTDRSAKWVAAICKQLDSNPMAIEIAATKVTLFTPRQIHDRLDERLSFFREAKGGMPVRHATLRGALDWNSSLLSSNAQTLFRRLGVMRGAYSMDTAAVICADDKLPEASITAAFEELVDCSILTSSPKGGDERLFYLNETYRLYAADLLRRSGEAEDLRLRRAKWAEAFCEEAFTGINGSDHEQWIIRLEAAYEDVREVARGIAKRNPEKAGRMAHACYPLLYQRGYFEEGIALFEEILRQPRAAACPSYARYLNVLATLLHAVSRKKEARKLVVRSLIAARRRADRDVESCALNTLGMIAYGDKRFGVARGCFLRSANMSREPGDTRLITSLANYLAALQGPMRPNQRTLFEEAYELSKGIGNTLMMSILRHHLAESEVKYGDPQLALRYSRDAMVIAAAKEDPLACQRMARTLTKVFAKLGDAAEAIRWYGFAESLYRSHNDPLRKDGDLLKDLDLAAGLDESTVAALLNDGSLWTYEDSVKLVNSTL